MGRESERIVLFDGVCNFCNGAVNFVIDRDPAGQFRFASLQSPEGRRVLRDNGRADFKGDPDSVVLVEGGKVFDRSDAALRIARALKGPVRLLWAFVVVPRFIRNAAYGLFARYRYRLFGKSEVCRVPTPELAERFL